MKFVVATFNPDKRRELEQLLQRPGMTLVSLAEVPGALAPEETGETLEDNARLKARAALALTGLPAIADDTGLEVEALGGRPGVRSARFAGENARYEDNVRRLLRELEGLPAGARNARFRTVCVACFPDGSEVIAEGVLEGRITTEPRGTHGFGYDPVFEVPTDGRTLAEMGPDGKQSLSHRARAVLALAAKLGPLLESS